MRRAIKRVPNRDVRGQTGGIEPSRRPAQAATLQYLIGFPSSLHDRIPVVERLRDVQGNSQPLLSSLLSLRVSVHVAERFRVVERVGGVQLLDRDSGRITVVQRSVR